MWAGVVILGLCLPQDEDKARKLLDQAALLADQEKYVDARDLFRQIARKFPDTSAGKTAAKRSGDNAFLRCKTLVRAGPSSNRIDITITGDGYLITKQNILDSFATGVVNCFKSENASIREYLSYFNFHLMNVSSKEAGVDTEAKTYDTAFNATLIRGSVRTDYALVGQMIEEFVPGSDPFAVISVYSGVGHSTGGGSMADVSGTAPGPVIHEFGHIIGLGDEYAQAVSTGGPNVSPSKEPDRVFWKHWLKDERIAKGAGLGIHTVGIGNGTKYIPTPGRCVMHTMGCGDFCAPCREIFLLCLYSWVRPIDEATPEGRLRFRAGEPQGEIFVVPMKPATHELTVEWRLHAVGKGETLEPEGEVPFKTGTDTPAPPKQRPTPSSADAIPLAGKIVRGKQGGGRHVLRFAELGLKPGTYAVIVSVKDEAATTVKVKGEVVRIPWVLIDERKILEERRRWIVVVEE